MLKSSNIVCMTLKKFFCNIIFETVPDFSHTLKTIFNIVVYEKALSESFNI